MTLRYYNLNNKLISYFNRLIMEIFECKIELHENEKNLTQSKLKDNKYEIIDAMRDR